MGWAIAGRGKEKPVPIAAVPMAAVERNLRRVSLFEDIVLHLGASPFAASMRPAVGRNAARMGRLVNGTTKRPTNHTACKRLNFLQVVCQQVPRRSPTHDPFARMEKSDSKGFLHTSGNAP